MDSPFLHTAAYKCRLRPMTSTLISPLHARKYDAIRENSRGKWPTVSLPGTTFTACFPIGLLSSRLGTSFSPINGFHTSYIRHTCVIHTSYIRHTYVIHTSYIHTYDKHDIHVRLMRKRTFPCYVVTKLSFCIVLLRLIFVQILSFSFQLWALVMKKTVVSQREKGNRLKRRF